MIIWCFQYLHPSCAAKVILIPYIFQWAFDLRNNSLVNVNIFLSSHATLRNKEMFILPINIINCSHWNFDVLTNLQNYVLVSFHPFIHSFIHSLTLIKVKKAVVSSTNLTLLGLGGEGGGGFRPPYQTFLDIF